MSNTITTPTVETTPATAPVTGFLEAIYSERDRNGNCYWALRFTDVATGKVVTGKVSGGESNIYSILRFWTPALDDWDRSIVFRTVPMKKQAFKYLTGIWEYAGCHPEELAKYIKNKLNT